ncbi:MAG: pyruvate dehydrogenase (acetyl-transferring), homodimeric type [Gammaproteobacteria bacterium RIFCSPHIGHO2_12_FULL_42_10]|nr:MAG: pyruvate dehydrogenase (acetyl-transferring), homodimeric type [Gammaproteobacteria bacterium RIFCSPHIGHO2_12_FULL_42_10]
MSKLTYDSDPVETREWCEALSSVVDREGKARAQFILQCLLEAANQQGIQSYHSALFTTPYCNTISVADEPAYPGDLAIEAKLEAAIRWNAIAMVIRAKQSIGGVGGHLSSFGSIATLYEVGLNHFFRGTTEAQLGDLIYFQGHSAEGNYARAYLEGRLSENHLIHFRQEVGGEGMSSYPHPWLMPQFWQFATVSLGLGMLQSIYQAQFLKYLENRQLLNAGDRKVWVFCGDGEMDEPESIGALTVASREQLDNLIFVVNCNLQRLDGLVRGNGKIIQELESLFRGAGWNVIKVLWDNHWDVLFEQDHEGLLAQRLGECVDGDLQTATVRGSAYLREFLFNTESLQALIEGWTDEAIAMLGRGGHDPVKIYAAYDAARSHRGQPSVVLVQSIKGYGLGTSTAEGRNVAHNHLSLNEEELQAFRQRFNLPLSDEALHHFHFYKPSEDSEEMQYLQAQRKKLGGYLPSRSVVSHPLITPPLADFEQILKGSGDRTLSTTMVLGRIFNILLKNQQIGPRVVPIFSDEVRTFGLETLFREIGIYSVCGQLYTPEDREQFLFYHETKDGQLLEQGITEAGSLAAWVAAGTSYATNRFPMIPFFVYYSMFGFQRVGDLIWAAGDMRARGFLIGATAGRTTLEGEGLQHQDGGSLLMASTYPTCRAYDPAFGFEMAVIIQHGLQEMIAQEKDVFYYITAMNERYAQPAMPEGVERGIIDGMYLFKAAHSKQSKQTVQLFSSGAILNEALAAQVLLQNDFQISANVWSVTSFSELHRDGLRVERAHRLHPQKTPELSYVMRCLESHPGPIVAATDYVRAYADLIRPYLERTYITLGTDGFGRSDTRSNLRRFFEVDRHYIVIAALYALMKEGAVTAKAVEEAALRYHIDLDKPLPTDM